ncbi:putative Sister-chromatid cohesion protein 3 [Blattamonas nauphoetae]|uniref:Sister-chromatid cohesion protein 3 n=1 Tax=Blattamonas nauphoetae TaxID=2049346 RepID=A0ABQ9XL02_9EUKA|nr:putative Sister-chromatid cohesion protein 3 [Blattamonas nauphoetae]
MSPKQAQRNQTGSEQNVQPPLHISPGLFDNFLKQPSQYSELARGWSNDYHKDHEGAVLALINFLIQSTGCRFSLEEIYDECDIDLATQFLQAEHLDAKKQNLTDKLSFLDDLINKQLFAGIFVHRHRDPLPLIRQYCIEKLGVFVLNSPESFLNGSTTNYIGLMLNDRDASVREASLRALYAILSIPEHYEKMGLFINRFTQRLVDITRDVSEGPAFIATQICEIINSQSTLRPSCLDTILLNLLDPIASLRAVTAHFLSTHILDQAEKLNPTDAPKYALCEVLNVLATLIRVSNDPDASAYLIASVCLPLSATPLFATLTDWQNYIDVLSSERVARYPSRPKKKAVTTEKAPKPKKRGRKGRASQVVEDDDEDDEDDAIPMETQYSVQADLVPLLIELMCQCAYLSCFKGLPLTQTVKNSSFAHHFHLIDVTSSEGFTKETNRLIQWPPKAPNPHGNSLSKLSEVVLSNMSVILSILMQDEQMLLHFLSLLPLLDWQKLDFRKAKGSVEALITLLRSQYLKQLSASTLKFLASVIQNLSNIPVQISDQFSKLVESLFDSMIESITHDLNQIARSVSDEGGKKKGKNPIVTEPQNLSQIQNPVHTLHLTVDDMTTEDEIAIFGNPQINQHLVSLTVHLKRLTHLLGYLSPGGIVLSLSATVNSVLQQMVKGSFPNHPKVGKYLCTIQVHLLEWAQHAQLRISAADLFADEVEEQSEEKDDENESFNLKKKSKTKKAAKTVKTKPKSQQKSVIEEEELELPNDLATVVPLDTFCPLFDNAVSTLKSLQYSPSQAVRESAFISVRWLYFSFRQMPTPSPFPILHLSADVAKTMEDYASFTILLLYAHHQLVNKKIVELAEDIVVSTAAEITEMDQRANEEGDGAPKPIQKTKRTSAYPDPVEDEDIELEETPTIPISTKKLSREALIFLSSRTADPSIFPLKFTDDLFSNNVEITKDVRDDLHFINHIADGMVTHQLFTQSSLQLPTSSTFSPVSFFSSFTKQTSLAVKSESIRRLLDSPVFVQYNLIRNAIRKRLTRLIESIRTPLCREPTSLDLVQFFTPCLVGMGKQLAAQA